jgi:hypothetical protein
MREEAVRDMGPVDKIWDRVVVHGGGDMLNAAIELGRVGRAVLCVPCVHESARPALPARNVAFCRSDLPAREQQRRPLA